MKNKYIVICLGIFLLLCSCGKVSGTSATYTTNSEIGSEVILTPIEEVTSAPVLEDTNHAVDTGLIYTGDAYVVVNNNEPYFTDDEKKFLDILAQVTRETLRELKSAKVDEDATQRLCKFGDFKYVYVKLSKNITQKQLSSLIKVALSKLGDMVQKNRKLFGVKSKKEV